MYQIVFSSIFRQAGVTTLEVKYDRFGNGDEETWQKPPSNTHNKRSLIRTCMYVTDFLQSEETSKWKRINTHTHTRARAHTLTHIHTHTHTHTHTHAYTHTHTHINSKIKFCRQSMCIIF